MCHTAGSFRRGSLWVEQRWREGGGDAVRVEWGCIPCGVQLLCVDELDVTIAVATNSTMIVQPLVCEQIARQEPAAH